MDVENATPAAVPAARRKGTPARPARYTSAELQGLLSSVVDEGTPLAEVVGRAAESGRAYVVAGGELAAVALSPQEYDRLVRDAGRRG